MNVQRSNIRARLLEGIFGCVARAVERHRPHAIRIVEAGEWRVQKAIEGWSGRFGLPVEIVADDRFICPLPDFFAWAASRRELVMENFYRQQRRRTGLLMEEDGKPVGGQWNFDKDNRAPPPKSRPLREPQRFPPDAVTREVIALVEGRFRHHFGTLDSFALPVTDIDRVTVRYATPLALMHDLRRMGAANALAERRRTPLRRATLRRLFEVYAERFADADGRIRATFEIVWLSGWAPHESQQKPLAPGSAKARLADALRTTEISTGEKAEG